MPAKKTIEEVKKEFEKYSYTLLENEYINQSTKMRCICAGGHYIEVTYKSVKKYKGGCKKCGYEKLSKMHSHNYEDVKKMFEDRDYVLLENEYKNEQTKMKYMCKNHRDKELHISLNRLKRSQGCPYCSKSKVDYDSIKEELEKDGYFFIDFEQVGKQSMIFYSCPNHPGEILHARPTDIRKGNRCKFCAYERRKGNNNCNWKGGITRLSNYLRHSAYYWKKEVTGNEELVCFVTKENDEEIEIHHLTPFYLVRDAVLKEYGYTGYEQIAELSREKLDGIRIDIEEKHKGIKGVPLKKSVHKKFHEIYGHDFKESDFWDFVERYKKGELH